MAPNASSNSDARPQRTRRRRRSRVVACLVLVGLTVGCVAVTYNVLRDRASAGTGLPSYSVYSDGIDGYAQAADLLRNLGWQPTALTRPIAQTHDRGLLILAEPLNAQPGIGPVLGLSDADAQDLLDWVRQGNTLLFCCSRNTPLHEKLGVSITEANQEDNSFTRATPGAVGEYTSRIQSIGIQRPATISGPRAVPLWWLGGKPAAVAIRYGSGRVLLVADPSILTHRGLLREDNAVFLYNAAALDAEDGRVYFDEYHHGFHAGGGFWGYLRYHGQHWIILQLLLVAGVAWWSIGRRLGRAVPIPVTKRADGVDYASSVARIYQSADVRPLVGKIMARQFLNDLTAHLRLRRTAEPKEVLAAWRQRYGPTATHELGWLLDGAGDLQDGAAPKAQQLVALSRRFDMFFEEQVRSKKGRPALPQRKSQGTVPLFQAR